MPIFVVCMVVFDSVSTIFRNHGAHLVVTPSITPKNTKTDHKTSTATFLDSSGVIVKLPYTLTVPFARHISQM